MKITFGVRKLGAKPSDDSDDKSGGFGGDDEDEDKPGKSTDDLGDASAKVAMRALVKALGIDPGPVDLKKAARAFRALVATCRDDDEGEGDDNEGY